MAKVIPFGDRIIVKRRVVGETIGPAGIIVSPVKTAETITDIADVIEVPEHSLSDKMLIENSEEILAGLTEKAKTGDAKAFTSLLQFGQFLKCKMVQPGDCVMIGKYVGVSFSDNSGANNLTLVREDDIIGLVDDE